MSLYLIRHASAGRRTSSVDDIDRPLDTRGWSQAALVCEQLGTADIDALLSSPALRCRQTVEPLAAHLGLDIEISHALWEGQGVGPALALVRRLVGANVRAALCGHGDGIPMVLDALSAEGALLAGAGCAKGSVWRLDVSEGQVVGGVYLPASEAVSR